MRVTAPDGLGRLAAMRRLPLAAVVVAFAVAGCGGGEEVAPVAETVEGETPQAQAVQGDPDAGKAVYDENGCGSCHAFEPAGSTAKVGPSLDDLEQGAKEANQGTVEEYARTSIVNPNAYVRKGYQPIMPPFKLEEKPLADLVAFVTQGD